MTDIRTKALALAAMQKGVYFSYHVSRLQFMAIMTEGENRHERFMKHGFEKLSRIEKFAEAAKALNLEPDQTVMALLEACEAALALLQADIPDIWRDRVCAQLQTAIAKARGEAQP